jgi:hypothetical protein
MKKPAERAWLNTDLTGNFKYVLHFSIVVLLQQIVQEKLGFTRYQISPKSIKK